MLGLFCTNISASSSSSVIKNVKKNDGACGPLEEKFNENCIRTLNEVGLAKSPLTPANGNLKSDLEGFYNSEHESVCTLLFTFVQSGLSDIFIAIPYVKLSFYYLNNNACPWSLSADAAVIVTYFLYHYR